MCVLTDRPLINVKILGLYVISFAALICLNYTVITRSRNSVELCRAVKDIKQAIDNHVIHGGIPKAVLETRSKKGKQMDFKISNLIRGF